METSANYMPEDVYSSRGYNVDFRSGYNLSPIRDLSTDEYLREKGYKVNDWNRYWKANSPFNSVYRDEWVQGEQDFYNQYKNWYDTNYNSVGATTQRQLEAGYTPQYFNGSVGSGATGDMQSFNYNPMASREVASNRVSNIVNSGSKVIDTVFGVANSIAGLKKTQADLALTDSKIQNVDADTNLKNKNAFLKWLAGGAEYYNQFGSDETAGLPVLVGENYKGDNYEMPVANSHFMRRLKSNVATIESNAKLKGISAEKFADWEKKGFFDDVFILQHYDAEVARLRLDKARMDKLGEVFDAALAAQISGNKWSEAKMKQNLKFLKWDKAFEYVSHGVDAAASLVGMASDFMSMGGKTITKSVIDSFTGQIIPQSITEYR